MRRLQGWILLCLLLVLSIVPSSYAYNAREHDKYLEEVLFGDSIHQNADALKMLKYASFLAIDQYNGAGTLELSYLRQQSVRGIPSSIDAFDFRANQYHRVHTHRGWDFTDYSGYRENADLARWRVRKSILLSTVNKVFGFKAISGKLLWVDFGHDARCDSFSALIYYIHILADHVYHQEEADGQGTYAAQTGALMMPVARSNPGADNPDIIWELQEHLSTLFEMSGNLSGIKPMLSELNVLRGKANENSAITAGLSSNEYSIELLELLKTHLPIQLRKEPFFANVFYPR